MPQIYIFFFKKSTAIFFFIFFEKMFFLLKKFLSLHSQNGEVAQLVRASDS